MSLPVRIGGYENKSQLIGRDAFDLLAPKTANWPWMILRTSGGTSKGKGGGIRFIQKMAGPLRGS